MARASRLYVFKVSHFCEKAAWACDHKRLAYEEVVLVPGPHRLTVRRLAPRSHVPVLVHEGRAIQNSSAIIDHLDAVLPDAPLTPRAADERERALAWERELDRELGEAARRVFYWYVLEQPRFLEAEYSRGAPFWAPWFFALALPGVMRALRRMYDVTLAEVERDRARLAALFARLDRELGARRYLVGDAFSRADLTLAALAAPLLRPAGHPVQWADEGAYPPGWIEATRPFAESVTAARVRELYRLHRPAPFALAPAARAWGLGSRRVARSG
ncbi:MAG TPA: glutathione S-transferase family protein [Polyangiaceae bacterium]|nr:glutathione S-transferase family protein [Polyangiaceae bacterium]